MPGGISALDVVQGVLLVDVDQNPIVDSLGEARTLDLARLEDGIAVGQNDGRSPFAQVFQNVERTGIEAVGERIIQ